MGSGSPFTSLYYSQALTMSKQAMHTHSAAPEATLTVDYEKPLSSSNDPANYRDRSNVQSLGSPVGRAE